MRETRKVLGHWRVFAVSAILLGLSLLLFVFYISYNKKLNFIEKDVIYGKYVAMITDESGAALWQSIYDSASEAGKENGIFVERFSDNFNQDYSRLELMEIAIASGVDGIIVSADESEEMTRLINEAAASDIPVITVYSDNTQSERLSFVGIGNYSLGEEYGRLITEVARRKVFPGDRIKVRVLADTNSEDYGQNILFAAIQEAIEKENTEYATEHAPIELSTQAIDATNNFSVEESVRSIFMTSKNNLPDIVVCLNEIDTTSLYQAVVDYNAVGLVTILGYYDSESILKGIERDVIYATVSIDTAQMGRYCIDALNEYYTYNTTNQYYSADISIIDKDNINKYPGGSADE